MNIYVVVEGKAEKCSGPLRLDSFLTVFSEHDEVVPAVAATEPRTWRGGNHCFAYGTPKREYALSASRRSRAKPAGRITISRHVSTVALTRWRIGSCYTSNGQVLDFSRLRESPICGRLRGFFGFFPTYGGMGAFQALLEKVQISPVQSIHPTCHKQVHSLGLTVLKPRPTKGR